MAIKWVTVNDKHTPCGKPFISIKEHGGGGIGVSFSVPLVETANICRDHVVKVGFDDEYFRVAFAFHKNKNDEASLPITWSQRSSAKIHIGKIVNKQEHRWLLGVAKSQNSAMRRFSPVEEVVGGEKIWTIQCYPAFESRLPRGDRVPPTARGIYRYKDGENVVYIGKGWIDARENSVDRKAWTFDVVEYSVVSDAPGNDPDKYRKYWEWFWLARFKKDYNRLPNYNRINGHGDVVKECEDIFTGRICDC